MRLISFRSARNLLGRMVEITDWSVTMHPIGPRGVFPPEMIAMDTLRSGPTPYGSCSVAESISLPMTALPTTGKPPSAAGTIGNCDRFSVSRNRLRVEFKGSGARKGHRRRGRHGGIDGDRLPEPVMRRPRDGIGQDCLCAAAPRRSRADIYGDCRRGSTVGRSRGRASEGWGCGRGRGEGAP
jgi:hypothetical protein